MRTALFDFDLPKERIAQAPIRPRDAARLLCVGAALEDRIVRDLPSILRPGDLMVVNDAKVSKTRFDAACPRGAVEITLIDQLAPGRWRAFAKPGRKLAVGTELALAADVAAEVVEKRADGSVVLTLDRSGEAMWRAFERHGRMPLPPYVKRPDGDAAEDEADYQTLFAQRDGAVAAPTAGLHFTPALMAALAARGVGLERLTLYVGAGTFSPVKAERIEDHVMHEERAVLSAETAAAVNCAKAERRRVIAIGTTSLRTLESAARDDGTVAAFEGATDLFLAPGAPIRTADLLLTNFHLPRSTLFMLVAAFSGLERMKNAYAHAVATGYRFYSYGDACLLERQAGE